MAEIIKDILKTVAALIITVAMGLGAAFYHGPAEYWVNGSLGGVFYEIFWCLFFSLIFTRAHPLTIALSVFIATCALEFMQLWHPPVLEHAREYFLGRALIGNCFSWLDFPYYAAGSAMGGILIRHFRCG